MNQEFWNSIESKYPLGKLIYGKVEFHAPFGVFVNLGDAEVKGLIQISDFLDTGSMTPEMYPDIDSPVEVRALVAEHPDATLVEFCELFAEKTGNWVSRAASKKPGFWAIRAIE